MNAHYSEPTIVGSFHLEWLYFGSKTDLVVGQQSFNTLRCWPRETSDGSLPCSRAFNHSYELVRIIV